MMVKLILVGVLAKSVCDLHFVVQTYMVFPDYKGTNQEWQRRPDDIKIFFLLFVQWITLSPVDYAWTSPFVYWK